MKLLNRLLLALGALCLSACSLVFDDLEPCPSGINMRLAFTHNLEKADAFASQVDCLTLHIFDLQGNLLTTVNETSSVLADPDWRLSLPLPPGQYHAVAYGGIACAEADFAHAVEPLRIDNIAMTLNADAVGTRLHDLFFGTLDFTLSDDALDFTPLVLDMYKTTNHFRIMLRQLDGSPINADDFDFFITDNNSVLDRFNRPAVTRTTTYPHWVKGTLGTSKSTAENDGQMAFAELSTSRLWLNNDNILRVCRHHDGAEIIAIPLNFFLLKTMSAADDWSEQEYLDRCSRWNLTFFLQGDKWYKSHIIINDWTVRINDIES